jgi:hypothetical protein
MKRYFIFEKLPADPKGSLGVIESFDTIEEVKEWIKMNPGEYQVFDNIDKVMVIV